LFAVSSIVMVAALVACAVAVRTRLRRAAGLERRQLKLLDVPLPGFWIGLPLGVAAIVLALRARREPISKAGRGMTVGAISLSTLAIGQMLIWTAVEVASADAPAATKLTFTELDRGSTFKHVRNTKTKNQRSNPMGDLIVFTSVEGRNGNSADTITLVP
jgi:hypothetical protein